MAAPLPWRAVAGGVELAVRLTPRGGAARIEGVEVRDSRACLRVRVAAPAVAGAANAALLAFLAKELRLPRSAVTLVAGERSRLKRLRLEGVASEAALAGLLGVQEGAPFSPSDTS